MTIHRETLIGLAHAERQRLGRMIQFADPDSWEAPSACPGWWNRDVMAHLAAQDTAAAQLVKGDPADGARGVPRRASATSRSPSTASTRGR